MEISSKLKGQFLRLYQMALTDGDFSPSEWKMLYGFAEERNVSKSDLDEILLNFSGKVEIPETLEERLECLFDLARMIWADKVVDVDEIETLKKYCRKFEFLEDNIDDLTEFLINKAKEGTSFSDVLKIVTQSNLEN